MIISEALSWAKQELKAKNVEGPAASAEFLLRKIINKDKAYIFAHSEQELTPKQQVKFEEWVTKRSKHEPVWYITGFIEFLGLDFFVNENVLIPRPETELLVELVVGEVKSKKLKVKSILDVGTGSGAIVLALANTINSQQSTKKTLSSLVANPGISDGPSDLSVEALAKPEGDPHFPPLHSSYGRTGRKDDNGVKFFASDISEEALNVARKNAKSLDLNDYITFKQGDLFEPWPDQGFDLIVTNLPYIPHEDMATLALDLVHYEPRTALDGGHEGLDIYIRFFESLAEHLNVGGKCFCEIGYDQGDKIQSLLKIIMPEAKVSVLGDYANIDRIVIIET